MCVPRVQCSFPRSDGRGTEEKTRVVSAEKKGGLGAASLLHDCRCVATKRGCREFQFRDVIAASFVSRTRQRSSCVDIVNRDCNRSDDRRALLAARLHSNREQTVPARESLSVSTGDYQRTDLGARSPTPDPSPDSLRITRSRRAGSLRTFVRPFREG